MIGRFLLLFFSLALALPSGAYAGAPQPEAICDRGVSLTIGVFPRRNPVTTNRMFSPLADYLEKRLGCPVRLVTAKDFDAFWAGVEAQRYDLVHYNQFHYVRSSADYRVILHNEEFGSGLIAGALFVRSGEGPDSPAALRGARVVFGGGPDAMMSHIVPRYLLLKAGLGPEEYESVYALNPPNAVLSTYYGRADAAGGGEVVGRLPVVERLVRPGELRIIARSEPLRHLPWVVRRALPERIAAAIRREMLALAENTEGRAILKSAGLTGISAANDGDYDDCRTIIRAVEAVMPLERGPDATP